MENIIILFKENCNTYLAKYRKYAIINLKIYFRRYCKYVPD